MEFIARCEIQYDDGPPIGADGQAPAIRAKGQALRGGTVDAEGVAFPRFRVPYIHQPVLTGRDECLAIGAEDRPGQIFPVRGQADDVLRAPQLDEADDGIGGRGAKSHALAIGTDRHPPGSRGYRQGACRAIA